MCLPLKEMFVLVLNMNQSGEAQFILSFKCKLLLKSVKIVLKILPVLKYKGTIYPKSLTLLRVRSGMGRVAAMTRHWGLNFSIDGIVFSGMSSHDFSKNIDVHFSLGNKC